MNAKKTIEEKTKLPPNSVDYTTVLSPEALLLYCTVLYCLTAILKNAKMQNAITTTLVFRSDVVMISEFLACGSCGRRLARFSVVWRQGDRI